MSKDGVTTNEIKSYLRYEAGEAKERIAAKQIEAAGKAVFGEDNFAYGREASLLARLPVKDLVTFHARVLEIRAELDSQFEEVMQGLGGNDEA